MSSFAGESQRFTKQMISKRNSPERIADQGFFWLTLVMAASVALLLIWIGLQIFTAAFPAISTYGLGFLTSTTWNPVSNVYGLLPQIYGTLVSALVALLIAVPLGVGVAVFLSEDFIPYTLRDAISMGIELIAAIPSVVLGLWGIFVFVPFMRPFYTFLNSTLGWIPLFAGSPRGFSLLTLSLVLSVMIMPIIISISRGTLNQLPPELRLGAMALGATRWETILRVLIPAGLSGIIGSVMLALGRAMGETMVAAMLVGNANRLSASLLDPGSTIASLIASQFAEAGRVQVQVLMYAGLVLMFMTLVINIVAEMIIKKFQNIE
ncbi:MAG: phosphate ABC transporter permease subunit PstC [Kaiparowitsia implicata GSE-PSE-MK54-09C]|jgi:phosphate transport system permease protein|nr:phosphate ABC transporter permease subunit PstC [Kaiparowitsia implicata GSE-PSE-MK54-09C]